MLRNSEIDWFSSDRFWDVNFSKSMKRSFSQKSFKFSFFFLQCYWESREIYRIKANLLESGLIHPAKVRERRSRLRLYTLHSKIKKWSTLISENNPVVLCRTYRHHKKTTLFFLTVFQWNFSILKTITKMKTAWKSERDICTVHTN